MSSTGEFMLVGKGLKKYIGPGGDVVIPESVTGIENYAFAGYKNLDMSKLLRRPVTLK